MREVKVAKSIGELAGLMKLEILSPFLVLSRRGFSYGRSRACHGIPFPKKFLK